jgi:hypothetical protein
MAGVPHSTVQWPEGKSFAFTVFDDPDSQTLEASKAVYSLLEDLGFRTTKAVWLVEPRERNSPGETCQSREFLEWAVQLQKKGFEIGYHNGAPGSLCRDEVIRSLDLFREYFGHDPVTMANHYNEDAIYWGAARLGSAAARAAYCAMRLGRKDRFFGHVPGHPSFWGDVCRQRIGYCRNFVFREVNTLRACPYMPYVDPERPYVARWFASSEGANRASFVRQLAEPEQDRLEEEGGACLMYAHFGHRFVDETGRLHPEFKRLMMRLAGKKGWFVPAGTLLEYLRGQRGDHMLNGAERGRLERRWLAGKLLYGTS